MGCACLAIYPYRACAQSLTWDEFVDKLTDQESENYVLFNDFYDELCYIHENPIRINSATAEELKRLPFLNAQQIEEIEAYVYSYGPIRSVGELNLIPYLDYDKRLLLALFITFEEKEKEKTNKLSFKNIIKYGKQNVVLRTDVPFYPTDEKYLGSSLYHSLRYQFSYNQRVEWGFTAEKDKGEPMLKSVDKWFDNYNYYLIIRNLGLLKTLAIGKYKLKFGQGLVLNGQFSPGKVALLSQLNNNNGNAISKHSSTSENGYFQGIAAELEWRNWQLYTFCSYRYQDATLNKDLLITSLKTDGYHRTQSEIEKKNNISNQLIGGHLGYNHNDFHIGLTTLYTVFNKPFITYPNIDHYKHFYPQGRQFANYSVDYSYINYHWTLKGEIALDHTRALATLHSIQYRPSSKVQLNLLYRYYDKKYNAIYGHSFGESSTVKNENGIYVGMVYKPLSRLKALAYVDGYDFPGYKYLVSAQHSKGIDALGQLEYTTSRKVEWLLKYRVKVKQQNYKNPLNSDQIALANRVRQTARIQAKYHWGKVQLNSQVNYSQFNEADLPAERGYAFSQQGEFAWKKPNIQLSVMGTYFHTDSYESNIYAYEKGLLYAFSFPSYYGHGMRFSTLFRFDINPKWMVQLKYGHTLYFDSSQQKKNNLQVQLRVKI